MPGGSIEALSVAMGFLGQGGADQTRSGVPATQKKRMNKPLGQYRKQPVRVRYCSDTAWQRRLQTIEVIAEETPWCSGRPARKRAVLVGARVGVQEVSLQRQVKRAGEVGSDSPDLGIAA
jgi:hypothetical protein